MRPKFEDLEYPLTSAEVREMPGRFQQLFQKLIPKNVSKLKSFLSSFLMLIKDKYVVTELQELIEETPVELQPGRKVNHVKKKFKMWHDLRMTAQIGDYDMDYIILDLGLDVNILTQQTRESMGKLRLD